MRNFSSTTGGGVTSINAHTGAGPINVTFENVTIARNGPNDIPYGDGAWANPGPAVPNLNLTFKNTILGQNRFGNGPGVFLAGTAGYTYTVQNSILENPSIPAGICGVNGVICGLDAKLESLTANGGSTATMALAAGSPAINAGAATTLTTDQRGVGFARTVGSAVDIGAFESSGVAAALPCKLDMDNDSAVVATKEGLVLLRAMLGFSGAPVVANTGITQAQWDAARNNLNANCGTNFAP